MINKTKVVPYKAGEMYALVNDIEAYPAFIPWCNSAEVREREAHRLVATLVLGVGKLHYSLTTENRMQVDRRIDFSLLEGPFKRLEGYWLFDELQDGHCRATLCMEFEFKNKMLALALNKFYEQVNSTLVDVFSRRAVAIYGAGSG
ncbi:MAG: type II toxin-antitoxin system RatA family toxin [Gammaproteobacteria bacterium]